MLHHGELVQLSELQMKEVTSGVSIIRDKRGIVKC